MKPTAKAGVVVACVLLAACGSDPEIDLPNDETREPVDEVSTRRAACDQAADGTPCGQDRHCVFNVCLENVCGDGVPAGGEACDDGNERDNDGCDQRCRMEVDPGCGNGVLEPGEACDGVVPDESMICTPVCTRPRCGDDILSAGEECDDGNVSDSDSCSKTCKTIPERCGNGDLDRNEECDDGNTSDADGCESNCKLTVDSGSSEDAGASLDSGANMDSGASLDSGVRMDSGASPDSGASLDSGVRMDSGGIVPDAGTRPLDAGSIDAGPDTTPFGTAQTKPACAQCRQEFCTNHDGILDVVAPCFQNQDPTFVQQCVDVIECAYQNDCAYREVGAPTCFCGTVDLAACQNQGAANGPCQAEWYAAARTDKLAEVVSRFGDISVPAGIANFLLTCDDRNCPACRP